MPRPASIRRGHTMLELVLAVALLAGTLVPALKLMRNGLSVSRDVETRGLLTTLAVSKLEETLAETGKSWATTTLNGTFSAEGYTQLRFRVDRSDAVAAGGLVGRLMAVTVIVWDDLDADATLDSNERSIQLGSKLAKMAVYQNAA